MNNNIHKQTPPTSKQTAHNGDSEDKKIDTKSVKITTDFSLLQYLVDSHAGQRKHKFSKAEAYFDLARRQRMTAITGDIQFMSGGIQELKNSWQWSRDTVSKFIAHLVKNGAANTVIFSTSVVVILTNLEGLPPLPEELTPGMQDPKKKTSVEIFHDEFCSQSAQNPSDHAL